MTRTLTEIKAHLRAVIANGSISTTLIQTEDLASLCNASDDDRGEILSVDLESGIILTTRGIYGPVKE